MAINNSSTCASEESLMAAPSLLKVGPFLETEQDVTELSAQQAEFWTERLRQCDGFKLDWLSPLRGEVGAVQVCTRNWSLKPELTQALVQRVGEYCDLADGDLSAQGSEPEPLVLALMTVVAVYLARLGDEPSGDIAFSGVAQRSAQDGNSARSVPLSVRLGLEQTWGNALVKMAKAQAEVAAQGSYSLDLLAQKQIAAPVLPLALTYLEPGAALDSLQAEDWLEGQLVNLVLNGTEIGWQYDAARLSEQAIARLEAGLESLITGILADPTQPLWQLPLLAPGERQQVLVDWNQTAADYDWDCCTHHLFEQQVEQRPDCPALQFGEQQLTYAELNQRANQVAHGLLAQGVQPDDIVAIHQDRSIELIVSVIAVLKAGCAYLPLDPEYPRDRLMLMVEDAEPKVILTQRDRQGQLAHEHEFCMDDASLWTEQSTENPAVAVQSHHLAYVIYTSGSTGRPKGVMIEHRCLSNYVQAARSAYPITAEDRMLQFASISFDSAAEEVHAPLVAGACLVLREPEMLSSMQSFVDACVAAALTVVPMPTAYWHLFVSALADGAIELPPQMRSIIIGGEAVNPQRVAQWQQMLWQQQRSVTLFNSYGPSEATVGATLSAFGLPEAEPQGAPVVTIGRPIGNYQVYILDQRLQPLPLGAAGELCIGGPGLARGYLKRPEKTAEQFVPHLLQGDDAIGNLLGDRIYRTGDLVRYLANGDIDYLGRIDNQVKIRGFRIELGEIETLLVQHSSVEDGVVAAREDQPGQKRLVAYVVLKAGETLDVDALRDHLGEKLPSYMVPAAFVALDALPMTPSGKVDRKNLPAPTTAVANESDGAGTELTETEQKLAEVWESLLGLDGIQAESHFFELGGDSLTALRMLVQLEKELGVSFTIADLFQAPTLGALAKAIDSGGERIAETTLMPLKQSGTKTPFFFINSMTFGTMLAPHLGEDYPMYCINIFGATEGLLALPEVTLRAMAERGVADMKVLQPHGPYVLGGYCDSSKMAFEMAQCLKEQGEEVALLAFLDATWEAEVNTLKSHFQNLLSFGPCYVVEKVGAKLKEIQEQRQIKRQQQESREKAARGEGETEVGRDILLLQQYNAAMAAHEAEMFDGAIDCFLCSELRMKSVPLVESVARDGVRIHTVTGYHHTLFHSPHVENLALQLREAMERALPEDEAELVEPEAAVS